MSHSDGTRAPGRLAGSFWEHLVLGEGTENIKEQKAQRLTLIPSISREFACHTFGPGNAF